MTDAILIGSLHLLNQDILKSIKMAKEKYLSNRLIAAQVDRNTGSTM
ncbi:MAG: hypothetical protein ACR2RF_03245 [Geminicoccaceae bacterium]